MIGEYVSTGSLFLSRAFSTLLYPSKSDELSPEELEKKINLAIKLVNTYNGIDAPMIISKLDCDAKTANKIINILLERGIIVLSK